MAGFEYKLMCVSSIQTSEVHTIIRNSKFIQIHHLIVVSKMVCRFEIKILRVAMTWSSKDVWRKMRGNEAKLTSIYLNELQQKTVEPLMMSNKLKWTSNVLRFSKVVQKHPTNFKNLRTLRQTIVEMTIIWQIYKIYF